MATEVRMAPRKLTDPACEKLKSKDRARTTYPDTEVRGLELRVSPEGARTFCLLYRAKGDPKKRRIMLGEYAHPGDLEVARKLALSYRGDARQGKDPRHEKREKIAEAVRQRKSTVASVAEAFIEEHVSKLRSKKHTEAEIRRYLMKPWGTRPIAGISDDDVAERIRAIKKAAGPHMARLVLSHAKRLFRWAAAPGRDGRIKQNPCVGLSARKDFDIALTPRQTVLSDNHVRLIWLASHMLDKPTGNAGKVKRPKTAAKSAAAFGPFFRLLVLSGQRRNEVAEMAWSEIDLDGEKVWVIPSERMKAGRSHEVPLSTDMVTMLEALQKKRGKRGDFVFSTTDGKRPISGFSKAKATLDAKISELRAQEGGTAAAANCAKAPADLPNWVLHDLRRTMRTGLGAIPSIPHDVRELTIAHIPPTLVQTYDLHAYRDEKRQALELWAQRLNRIVSPPPEEAKVTEPRRVAARTKQVSVETASPA